MLRSAVPYWFAALILALVGFPSQGASVPVQIHPTRILVKPKPGVDLSGLHARHRARLLRVMPGAELQVVELSAPGQVADKISAYQRSGQVEFAEPDYILHTTALPDDPGFTDGSQWALQNTGQSGGTAGADISAPVAWSLLSSASNIVVAIVDTGIRYTHEDLVANLWTNSKEIAGNGRDDDNDGYIDDVHGINAIDKSGDPWDDTGHGTHVAGIIGAVGNNGIGVSGVAWKVQLMACKFMDSTGNGATSDAITCIDYARLHGANIINASWGGPGRSTALQNAIKRAQAAGIIFVVAAGNDSQNLDTTPSYPASYKVDNVVVVAATTRNDLLADYSNYGAATVTLGAPGSAIASTWNDADNAYAILSGTSMATPYVSGVLALTKARFPADSYSQLIRRVAAAGDVLPALAGKCSTGGRLNLRKAIGAPAAAIPAKLDVLPTTAAGRFQFRLAGDPNAQYVIEASIDLVNWSAVQTLQSSAAGVLTFNGGAPGQDGRAFYRARLVPVQ